jgi:hypothetical protein
MLKTNFSISLKILLITILASLSVCNLDKEKVVLAINCGGPEFTDSNGVEYKKVNYIINFIN